MAKKKAPRERNVDTKVVPELLKKLGYSDTDWEADYAIQAGRTTVAADFIVSSNLDDTENAINLIIDSKKDDEVLENYIPQVVSYGRLVKARYSILVNSSNYIVIDNATGVESFNGVLNPLNKQFKDIFTKSKYFHDTHNQISFTPVEIDDAKKIVMTFEEIKQFNKVLVECQNIIRDRDGLTGSDAFDELSKILFIKIYLENETSDEIDGEDGYATFSVKKMDECHKMKMDWVATQFENVKAKYSLLFKKEDAVKLAYLTVREIVGKLEKYDIKNTNVDIKGNAYEILLGKTFLGALGQHFTPRTVVDFMIKFINPAGMITDEYIPTVIDPSCGTGGFLVRCLETYLDHAQRNGLGEEAVRKIKQESIYGIDLNPRSAQVTKMNMSLHGDGHGGIYHGNGLVKHKGIEDKKFDVILTNPPFGVNIKEPEILRQFDTAYDKKGKLKKSCDSTYLFTEHCLNLLAEDGKIGVVLPNGILNNSNDSEDRLRVLEKINIDAMIALPNHSFKFAKANACTSILFGTKTSARDDKYIFMAVPEEIGYERVTQFATEIKQNDLLDVLEHYKNYQANKSKWNKNNKEYIVLSSSPAIFLLRRDLFTEKRFDATYYYSEYIYKNKINNGDCVRLSEYATFAKRNLDEVTKPTKYIEISNVVPNIGSICACSVINNEDERNSRAKLLLREQDIIAARMTDTEANIAVVPAEYDGALATNGFMVFNPIPPMTTECLYYLLKNEHNRNQVRFKGSNTIMPSIYDYEYFNNWLPRLTEDEIERITMSIKASIGNLQDAIRIFNESLNQKMY